MTEYILRDWAIIESKHTAIEPYLAPEQRKYHLIGKVYSHPRFDAGSFIETTSITNYDVASRILTTRTGNKYKLENPKSDYKEFVEKSNPDWKYKYLLEWNND